MDQGRSLDRLTIRGFKSLRALEDLRLTQRNVLIGANGAGKSNFIDFFRTVRALALDGLQHFVNQSGGADGFFFEGPQVTRAIEAELRFGLNGFRFKLSPAADGLMVDQVARYFAKSGWKEYRRGKGEAGITGWAADTSLLYPKSPSAEAYVYAALASWIVYHFHDTSMTSPMRREGDVSNHRELAADGGNLAAFLAHLRGEHPAIYQRIRETIQIVAPFFDDFLLEPSAKGPSEKIKLEWRQRGSTYPYQPWQLSDGTIRFIALTTALLQPNPPATIIIDEPELGLHPVALRVFAALVHETSLRHQTLISTQSPLLVDHFDPEDLIVVERKAGATELRRLDPADLERWLEDFTLGDLIEKNVIETNP
ncbi:MAG: AAA family ATPase [Nannocystis sp.]|nr:AAA family ATPase [Nannocystis sp.]